jgi:PAS domain S-box-containing protein
MLGNDAPVTIDTSSLPVLRDLGEVLELGVLAVDRELVVQSWNRWLAAASGMESSLVVGRNLLDVFSELRDTPAEEALRRALTGVTTVWAHRFHRYFLPLPAPVGHPAFGQMQQSVRIMPLMQGGGVHGAVLLIQDVTERVAREEELRAALSQAEVASEAKSNFLAAMSHELRTPLGAIIGFMDLLAGEMAGPVMPLQRDYLSRVKAAAKHLIRIIEEILTFSRVEAGKEPLQLESLDCAALMHDVRELFEPQALAKGLALVVTIPEVPVTLWTDGTKVRQILINVVGNALKFTDEGEVSLELSTDAERVRFCIRDSGPGIDADDLERIFDPFTQLDQTLTRIKGGTGLGLPVSRRLAQLLGGDLLVESTPHEGTSFTCWLPLRAGVGQHPEHRAATEAVGATRE